MIYDVPPDKFRCTRLTKADSRCKMRSGSWYVKDHPDPRACGRHRTPEEREIERAYHAALRSKTGDDRVYVLLDAWDERLNGWQITCPTALPESERSETCMRRRNDGKPCTLPAAHKVLGSCGSHLTEEERAAKVAAEDQRERDFWLALDQPPRCWFWPVPRDVDKSSPERALIEWQAGRCAICGSPDDLVEDHDHATGMVRGWICRSDNIREGLPLYRYGATHIYSYWRSRPATAVLGVSYRYISPLWGPDPGYGPPPDPEDRWRDNAMRGVL